MGPLKVFIKMKSVHIWFGNQHSLYSGLSYAPYQVKKKISMNPLRGPIIFMPDIDGNRFMAILSFALFEVYKAASLEGV